MQLLTGAAKKSPELRELSMRMVAIAEEEGLERVDDGESSAFLSGGVVGRIVISPRLFIADAVTYMQSAMHAHLTRLMKAAAPGRPSGAGAGIKREREDSGGSALGEPWVISRGSLCVAVAKSGKGLLCDDLPLQREKLLLLE